MLLLHELKDLLNRRVPLAPGRIVPDIKLPIRKMHARNPGMVFLDERYRTLAGPSHVMANVDVGSVVR